MPAANPRPVGRAALSVVGLLAGLLALGATARAAEPAAGDVRVARVPDGGIQPQAAVDAKGTVHLVYFKGEASRGDAFYVRSTDGAETFSEPLRVNSQPGSVIATGTVRGAHLALGRGGRPHVAWMGSGVAEPKAGGKSAPMLYARLNDAGDAFEPQRNVIAARPGLDGGGSVAADGEGNVYVAWHAPKDAKGEADRRVWVARSTDDGKTFAAETVANADPTGACGCCGMRVFAGADGRVVALYRSATDEVNRDMTLLQSADHGKTFAAKVVGPWRVNKCVMSTAAFGEGAGGRVWAAWEQEGQVYAGRIDPTAGAIEVGPMPGDGKGRKHPAVAVAGRGEHVVAWTEGTGWNKGGSVAWQAFDAEGKAIGGKRGRADGLPAWGLPAVVALADGSFRVIY